MQLSFNVESLFTSIPTPETTEITLDNIYIKIRNISTASKEELEELLKVCIQESYFQFNERFRSLNKINLKKICCI